MNGCIYRTKDGECDLWTDNDHLAFCDIDSCADKKPSNSDRIKSMSDEELAKRIVNIARQCAAVGSKHEYLMSEIWWLDWLRKGAKDE